MPRSQCNDALIWPIRSGHAGRKQDFGRPGRPFSRCHRVSIILIRHGPPVAGGTPRAIAAVVTLAGSDPGADDKRHISLFDNGDNRRAKILLPFGGSDRLSPRDLAPVSFLVSPPNPTVCFCPCFACLLCSARF